MNTKSFTLIEILVVATIIGLLSVLGIISYSQFTKSARDARRKSDIENIRVALESYKSNTNYYPYQDSGDVPPQILVTQSYLKEIPKDPKSTQDYSYTAIGCDASNLNCSSYTLIADLEFQLGATYDSNPLGSSVITPTPPP